MTKAEREEVVARYLALLKKSRQANFAVDGAVEELYRERLDRDPNVTGKSAAYLLELCGAASEAKRQAGEFLKDPLSAMAVDERGERAVERPNFAEPIR